MPQDATPDARVSREADNGGLECLVLGCCARKEKDNKGPAHHGRGRKLGVSLCNLKAIWPEREMMLKVLGQLLHLQARWVLWLL